MINLAKRVTYLISIALIIIQYNVFADDKPSQTLGNITLKDIIQASPNIADSTPSKYVNKSIPGTIIQIKNKNYEIRFFSFEDTANTLDKNTRFRKYIEENKLGDIKSIISKPLTKVVFEHFSFRQTKKNNQVYFGIGLRVIK